MKTQKSPTYTIALIIIALAFFIIGFGVGINGIMIPVLEGTFSLSKGMSYLILTATFSTFLIFGAPAGWTVKKIGYKKSLILALAIMSLGMFLFIASAKMGGSIWGFYMFLFASFIGGIGNTLLQTGINPYVTICGPIEKAAQRMCAMGVMNQSAWFLGPIFLSLFIDIAHPVIDNAVLPFGIAGLVIGLLAICILFLPLPEVKAIGEDAQIDDSDQNGAIVQESNSRTSVWLFPHLFLGMFALFLYVGVETLPMASIIDFASSMGVDNPAKYSAIGPMGMIIGYAVSIFVLQALEQSRALVVFALIALLASLGIVFLPMEKAIYCVAGLGFAHSIMWGCLWALTIRNLGKHTKTASSMLVVSMVGGAIIPLLFGFLLDLLSKHEAVTANNFQMAYVLLIPCYMYILFYGAYGYKIGR